VKDRVSAEKPVGTPSGNPSSEARSISSEAELSDLLEREGWNEAAEDARLVVILGGFPQTRKGGRW
jgi:hypothetical protein